MPVRHEAMTTVTVSRKKDGVLVEWTLVVRTTPKGRWLTHFTLGFSPNEDRDWFGRTDPADGVKKIATSEEHDDFAYIPSVMFSRKKGKDEGKYLTYGPSGGIGLEGDKPAVFAGLHLTYRDNLAFFIGPVFRERAYLRGQYEEGDAMPADTTNDQLVEHRYGLAGWVGVGYRFKQNPLEGELGDNDSRINHRPNSLALPRGAATVRDDGRANDPSLQAGSPLPAAARGPNDPTNAQAQGQAPAQGGHVVVDGLVRTLVRVLGEPDGADSTTLDDRRRLLAHLVPLDCSVVDDAGGAETFGPRALSDALSGALRLERGVRAGVDQVQFPDGSSGDVVHATATLLSLSTDGTPAGMAVVALEWMHGQKGWILRRAMIVG